MPTRTEWAWAAGLYEGEGSVHNASRTKDGSAVTLTVAMTDKDTVEKFASVVGARLYGPYKTNGTRKPVFRACLSGWERVDAVRTKFAPYLCVRRTKQLDAALAIQPYRARAQWSKPCERASYAGYGAHAKRKEPPCLPCRKAASAYMLAWRKRR